MQSAGVVYLVDEAWKPRDHVSVSPTVTEVNLLALDFLDETLGFSVVVWIAASTHRTDQPVFSQFPTIGLGSVLCTTIGMMDAAGRRLGESQSRPAAPPKRTPPGERLSSVPPAQLSAMAEEVRPSPTFRRKSSAAFFDVGAMRASYGAHSYFVQRREGNLLIDSPRSTRRLENFFEEHGGIAAVLLTHRNDVSDADKYAAKFASATWIHEADRNAAPFATDTIVWDSPRTILPGVKAIPIPAHTAGALPTWSRIDFSSRAIPCTGTLRRRL